MRWTVDIYHNEPHPGLLEATPAEVWDRAMEECRPGTLTLQEMRHAFGVRRHRKPGQRGISCHGIWYLTQEFARILNAERLSEIDIVWWEGDIGAIEVCVGKDRWITVTVSDERWIGKDYDDLLEMRRINGDRPEGWDDAAHLARVALDDETFKLAKLRKLVRPSMTPAQFDRLDAEFRRFCDTADRRFDQPEAYDLLGGLDGDEACPPRHGGGRLVHDGGRSVHRGSRPGSDFRPLDPAVPPGSIGRDGNGPRATRRRSRPARPAARDD